MIIILDDTFDQRQKYHDVSYFSEEKYKDICTVHEYPTLLVFKNVIQELDNIQLICNHRSLRLFNREKNVIDGKEAIKNLFNQIDTKSILRLEFGRDMHSNFDAKTLDKDLFYTNLKPFLDNYLATKEIELKILFYGINYKELERMTQIDLFLNKINLVEIKDFKNNKVILNGVKLVFPNEDPNYIINNWIDRNLSKKQIRDLINTQI